MKFFFLFLAQLFLQLVYSDCYGQWTWRNPLPQGNYLYSVVSPESDVVIAGGDCSTIMRSMDNGLTWNVQILNRNRIYDTFGFLDFPEEATGYAGSSSAVLYKTIDGGQTWDSIFYDPDDYFYDLCFTTSENGFISAGNKLIKTNDGGFTWEEIFFTDSQITDIDFPSSLTGYLTDACGKILKTVDGGSQWQPTFSDSSLTLEKCYFLNEQEGIIITDSNVYLRTSDGGVTWLYNSLIMVDHLSQGLILNQDTILLSGYPDFGDRCIYRSTDGGNTWDSVYSYLTFSMGESSNGVIFCVGWAGKIARSDDYGATWIQLTQEILTDVTHWDSKISDIDFADGSTGYAVSYGYEGCTGSIIKTGDGGDNWFQLQYVPDDLFFNVDFINQDVGCITGFNGIYNTTNGGTSWHKTYNTSLQPFQSQLDFYGQVGFAAGSNGMVLKSTDMGQSWITIANVPQNNYHFVEMANDQTVYLLGDGKKISKSTDQGVSWQEITIPYFLSSVYFFNSMEGIGAGEGIYKTSDGGNTWEICFSNSEDLYDVGFYDFDTGYVSGGTGTLLKTTDHGLTWGKQFIPVNWPVYTICSTADYKFYIGSNYGMLLGTTNGGLSTRMDTVYKDFSGFYIFPNPVKDFCNLKVKEPFDSDAGFQIIDMTGKEVRKIILKSNDLKRLISLDMRSIPPGFYILRISSGEKSSFMRRIIKE